jgi:ATP-dependent Lon protease
VLIPKENEKDLVDIPANVKSGLEIIPVGQADEVLRHALVRPLTPIEWIEPIITAATTATTAEDPDAATAH